MTEKKKTAHPVLDERFITSIKGREFVLYAGLLDLAHQKGLKIIHVEAIQYPTKSNGMEGICKAVVESRNGEEFTEIGDANPKNVNKQIADHVLRMAATRAKARALRDFTNIGMTCLEELGDLDNVIGEEKPKPKATKRSPKKTPAKAKKPAPTKEQKPESKVSSINANKPRISQAQKQAILNLSRRRGIDQDSLEAMVEEAYGVALEGLTSQDAAHFIRNLQQAA